MKRTIFLLTLSLFFLMQTSAHALSEMPYMTEIMANPEGSDSGNEWIEIYNPLGQEINLENWIIRNSTKEFKLKKFLIPRNSYGILKGENLKLTIKNSEEEISLLSPDKQIISKVEIAKSSENKSLSLIEIKSRNLSKKLWMEDKISPGEKNNVFIEIDGEITAEIKISKKFEIEIDKKKILIEDNFDFNSLRAFLKPGDKVKALIKTDGKNYFLKKIKLIDSPKEKPKKNENTFYYLLVPIIAIFIYLIIESNLYKSSHYKSAEQTRRE